jgi:MGT family glycosyltransferase
VARVLFVVPPLHGHTNPTVAVGSELTARGHDVAWCGYRPFVEPLVPPGSTVLGGGADATAGELMAEVEERSKGLRGAAALKFFWEEFLGPLADAMVVPVEEAVAAWAPDVVVVDQQTVAGALVARRRGLPWATSATTPAELVDPFADFPKLKEWSDGCLVDFQLRHGVAAGEATAERLRFSDDLVLAFTTAVMAGAGPFPAHWQFVGPAFAGRPAHDGSFPWEWLERPGPTVLVSLGTVNAEAGGRFYRVVADAADGAPFDVVLSAPPEVAGEMPENVLVRPRVPQVELLAHLDAVVCHAGNNTVCEALAHGLPLVVAPIRDDQPVIAGQVVAAGAGVRVKFVRTGPAELRDAIVSVLTDPSYRRAAESVRASFEAAGGAPVAAGLLEKLAAG